MAAERNNPRDRDVNPDPITGEPGSHPVGTGLGTAAGGAAAGLAAGAAAGPIGAAVGAIAGGVAGAFAGKAIAEEIDPTVEAAYWRDEYPNRDYYSEEHDFETMEPAYRHGWESRNRYRDQTWDQAEPMLRADWEKSERDLQWDRARQASRDAWERIERNETGRGDAKVGRTNPPT